MIVKFEFYKHFKLIGFTSVIRDFKIVTFANECKVFFGTATFFSNVVETGHQSFISSRQKHFCAQLEVTMTEQKFKIDLTFESQFGVP